MIVDALAGLRRLFVFDSQDIENIGGRGIAFLPWATAVLALSSHEGTVCRVDLSQTRPRS